MLRNLHYRTAYDSDSTNMVAEFYNPVLQNSTIYKRTAGFFSSSVLVAAARGLEVLFISGGTMQIIVSPELSSDDIEAMVKGYESRETIIEKNLLRELAQGPVGYENRLNYLAWLIAEEKLDIKVVVRKDFKNSGMFHEKSGVFVDSRGDKVAFRGSMNESKTAYEDNYEAIEVYLSWEPRDALRIKSIEDSFDKFWNNQATNWSTYELPHAVKNKILEHKRSGDQWVKERNRSVKNPQQVNLRQYQKDAINKWLKANGRGIFEMATGTGKTITSLWAVAELMKVYMSKKVPIALVIVVPYKVLLEQWIEELSMFNIEPISAYQSYESWYSSMKEGIAVLNAGGYEYLAVITTTTTFKSAKFQELLDTIKTDYILLVDEMHHLTTDKAINSLPEKALYRLGLSATLTNKYKEKEVTELVEYFGNNYASQYSLEEAIKNGFLTPYYYYPIFVELTDDEKEKYFELSVEIGRKAAISQDLDDDNSNIKNLLIQRARIIASAANKIEALRTLEDKVKNSHFNIFYCGDKIENEQKFVEKVNSLLATEFGMKTHTFTSAETNNTRKRILDDFKNKEIQALTAIRCLDEGVDIPRLERAFILSSGSNPKEFIQRRGRILRKSAGKQYAEIYDFIVVPTMDGTEIKWLSTQELEYEWRILTREFERYLEFANMAVNKEEALAKFTKILVKYSLKR